MKVQEMRERRDELLFLLKNREYRKDQTYETYRELMQEYDQLVKLYCDTLGIETGGK